SARRSEADAQASFRSLQSKFPRQLGGRTAIVQRADLGPKGIYYRALVGPFASAGAADQFCSSLKAAGGQCVVQRNCRRPLTLLAHPAHHVRAYLLVADGWHQRTVTLLEAADETRTTARLGCQSPPWVGSRANCERTCGSGSRPT